MLNINNLFLVKLALPLHGMHQNNNKFENKINLEGRKMASIVIKDLEVNEDLDKKALESLLGGRWVRRRFTRRYTRWYTRTVRRRYTRTVAYYRTARVRYRRTFTQSYWRTVWV